jgi:DNA-directed RNA polymerase specialized sigma24 family protein
MDETRQSLLLRAQTGETNAWKDLTDLYRPLIRGWLLRQGVPARDLDDLSQEVLLSVVKHLPDFRHSGNRGAFRAWLRTIVCRRTADYWRSIDALAQARSRSRCKPSGGWRWTAPAARRRQKSWAYLWRPSTPRNPACSRAFVAKPRD